MAKRRALTLGGLIAGVSLGWLSSCGDDAGTSTGTDATVDVIDDVSAREQEAASDAGVVDADASTAPDGALRVALPAVPCGIPGFPRMTDAGNTADLIDLGSAGAPAFVGREGHRVLSVGLSEWMLWDEDTLMLVARGPGHYVGAAIVGAKFTIGNDNTIELRDARDGSLIISKPVDKVRKGGLSEDGSYIWSGGTTGLYAWSPEGSPLVSISGDYSTTLIYAAAGELRVGTGSKVSVIKTDGTPTMDISFTGTIAAWFGDGSRFMTTADENGVVTVYDKAGGAPVGSVKIGTPTDIGGYGNYVFTFTRDPKLSTGTVRVFTVGNDTPIGTYVSDETFTGGYNISRGVIGIRRKNSALLVVMLTPSGIRTEEIVIPTSSYPIRIGADSSFRYAVSDNFGGVYRKGKAGDPNEVGVLGCGLPLSLATSPNGIVAVITSGSGEVLVYDVSQGGAGSLVLRRPLISTYGMLTADGTRLVTFPWGEGFYNGAYLRPTNDRAVHVLDLPSGTEKIIPSDPQLDSIRLATGGKLLGRSFWQPKPDGGTLDFVHVVTKLEDDSEVFRRTVDSLSLVYTLVPPVKLSPSGDRLAIPSTPYIFPAAKTDLYEGGQFKATVDGHVFGFLDEDRILAQTMSGSTLNGVVYDISGTAVSTFPWEFLQTKGPFFDPVLYDANHVLYAGKTYDLTTGAKASLPGNFGTAVTATRLVGPRSGHFISHRPR